MTTNAIKTQQITDQISLVIGHKQAKYTITKWNNMQTEFPQEISVDIFPLLIYQPLGSDFGPYDLATTCRAVRLFDHLCDGKRKVEIVVPSDPRKISNMLVLIFAYLTTKQNFSVKQMRSLLIKIRANLREVVEPAPFVCPLADKFPLVFHLHVEDVVEALVFAHSQRWLDLENIDPEIIEYFQHPNNGDLSFVVPGKFVAFAGPSSFPGETAPPHSLVPILKNFGVSTVVRLNYPRYAAEDFRSAGLDHHDLIFPDGSCPEQHLIEKFLAISETSEGVVAVHCKAGLGRTGTLIAYWIMRNFRVSARVAIAWLRIARPGSVLGPQQQFLEMVSENFRSEPQNNRQGDRGQGARLLKRKRTNS